MMKKGHKIAIGLLVLLLTAIFFKVIIMAQAKMTWLSKESGKRTAENEEEFIWEVYEGMLSGEKDIEVSYYGRDYKEIHNNFLKSTIKKIFAIDDPDTTDDFDYMSYNLDEVSINTKSALLNSVTITISPKWKESKKETKTVNKKIEKILKELNLDQDSNYKKIKKIHDYMVRNFSYDEELKNYTVYDGLKNKKMVCQGYMLLAYKLLAEAGIPVKCVDGTATNSMGTQTHGWNLVKIGKYWYNFDATWDDPILWGDEEIKAEMEDHISYEYFLKGSGSFSKKHAPGKEFRSAKFKKQYPVSKKDYPTQSLYK
ncbi:MAG: transglutaminase domain-containing protein [Acetivibrio sp.]